MYKCECVRCGWIITGNTREKILHSINNEDGIYRDDYSECPMCRLDGLDIGIVESNTEVEIIKCKDCGEEFFIADDERKFFESKGLHLPKRCSVCRNKRKVEKEHIVWTYYDREGKDFRSREIFYSLKEGQKQMGELVKYAGEQNGAYKIVLCKGMYDEIATFVFA